jgi:hypothetical protein
MRTIRESKAKETTFRLVEKSGIFVGLIIEAGKIRHQLEGTNADELWQKIHDEHSRLDPQFFGYDGAISRFCKIFPDGFQDPAYLAQERNYKLAAKKRLDETVPLAEARTGSGYGEKVLAVFQATNLLSPFEKVRLSEALRGTSADSFVRGAASFASGEINSGLAAMKQSLKSADVAKWTAVTYLPYLWRPEAHIFLKPQVTREFATRVGHSFAHDYSSDLHPATYISLLELARQTQTRVASLAPRDLIDVQSFLWVVGEYPLAE